MRTALLLAAGLALAASPVLAQQQPATPQPTPEAQQQAPSIQSITVIDVAELPEETQAQVERIESQRSDAEFQAMRRSIDASPHVLSALEARGVTSADVVVASLDPKGALTLVTRKKNG